MYLNIQFSQEKFQRMILHYVRKKVLANENLGLGGIRSIPFNPFDNSAPLEEGVIDHITIDEIELDYPRGAGAPRDTAMINLPPLLLTRGRGFPIASDIDIPQLLAYCNISVYAVRLTDLETAGLDRPPASAFTRFQVQVTFNVTQPAISGGNLLINFIPLGIGFGLGSIYIQADELENEDVRELADDLLQLMQDNAEEWFPAVSFPVANLDEAFGTGLRIWNAGIRKSGSVIDLQLQADREDIHSAFRSGISSFNFWVDEWSTYFTNSVIPRLGSLDWGVFFPFEMFDNRIKDAVTSALLSKDEVVLNAPPESSWHITNTSAGTSGCFPGEAGSVKTHIAVYLPGACEPWGYDMDVNLSLTTEVSIPRPGILRLELRASHEVDPGDIFVCGSLNAFLFSGAGVAAGGVFGGWVGGVIGGVIGGLFGGFATMGVILSRPLSALNSSMLTRIDGEENAYYIEIEIDPVNNRILGNVAITDLTPCQDGLFSGGTLNENPGILAFLPEGSLAFPRWRQPGRSSCTEEGEVPSIIAELGFSFYRDAHPDNISLVTWNYEVLEASPDSGWPEPNTYENSNSIVYRYNLPKSQVDSFRSDTSTLPSKLKILYQSNFGARLFSMPIPDERLSDSEYTTLIDEINERCNANQELIDMFEDRTRNLRDILNAPEFIPDFDMLDGIWWTVNFVGIDTRAKVRLNALEGDSATELASLRLDNHGNGRIDLWLIGDDIKLPLQLSTAALNVRDHGDNAGFMTGMRAYRRKDSLAVSDYVDHTLARNSSGLYAAVLTKNALSVYKLDSNGSFYAIYQLATNDLVSVGVFNRHLLVTNTNGKQMSSFDGSQWKTIKQDNTSPKSRRGEPQTPKRSARSSAYGHYALVLNHNRDRLQLLEQVYTDVGGFRYAKGSSKPNQNPIQQSDCE